jgi:hypothetical protein
MRGASAYASAPSRRVVGDPIRSRLASAMTPRKATLRRRAIHSRCSTHGAIPAEDPSAKNGPMGNR